MLSLEDSLDLQALGARYRAGSLRPVALELGRARHQFLPRDAMDPDAVVAAPLHSLQQARDELRGAQVARAVARAERAQVE